MYCELLANAGMQYMGAPTQRGGHLAYELEVELVGLVRDVERLESVRGEARLSLPVAVYGERFDPLRTGERVAGPWRVQCTAVGTSTELHLVRESAPAGNREVSVRHRADGTEGAPLGIRWESASGWENDYRSNLETPQTPAALSFKVLECERASFPFELRGVPLAHAAEQPEHVAALEFTGAAPLAIEHRGAAASSTPDFPQVRLSVSNGANKDALEARVTFVYLDAKGAELESFPHQLQGAFGFEGQEPLARAGTDAELETTAFFRPEETASIRIVLEEVRFLDGTLWTRED